MDWAGFLSYVVLNCITPGPNNMICMSGAAQRGFLYSLRYIFGVFLGFLAVSLLAGGFTALLYDALPAIEPWLLALGAAYILYLAWLVWKSTPGEDESGGKSRGVISGVVLQFVNVKGILFAVTAMGSYVLPHYRSAVSVLLCSLLMAMCCFVCCCVWALGGSALVWVYKKHTRPVNAVMALALVWCASELILELIRGLAR